MSATALHFADFDEELGWYDDDLYSELATASLPGPGQQMARKASTLFGQTAKDPRSTPSPIQDQKLVSLSKWLNRGKKRELSTPGSRKKGKIAKLLNRQALSPTPGTYAETPARNSPTSSAGLPRSSSSTTQSARDILQVQMSSRGIAAGPSGTRHSSDVEHLSSSLSQLALDTPGRRDRAKADDWVDVPEGEEVLDEAVLGEDMGADSGENDGTGLDGRGQTQDAQKIRQIVLHALQDLVPLTEQIIATCISEQTDLDYDEVLDYFTRIRHWQPTQADKVKTGLESAQRLAELKQAIEKAKVDWIGAAMPCGIWNAPIVLQQAWPTSKGPNFKLPDKMLVPFLYTTRMLLDKGFGHDEPRMYAYDVLEVRQGSNVNHTRLPRYHRNPETMAKRFYKQAKPPSLKHISRAIQLSLDHSRDVLTNTALDRYIVSQGEFTRKDTERIPSSPSSVVKSREFKLRIPVPAITSFGIPDGTIVEVPARVVAAGQRIVHVQFFVRHGSCPKYDMARDVPGFHKAFASDAIYNLALDLMYQCPAGSKLATYSMEAIPITFEDSGDGGQQALQAYLASMRSANTVVTANTLPSRFAFTLRLMGVDIEALQKEHGEEFLSACYSKMCSFNSRHARTAEERSAAGKKAYLSRLADPAAYWATRQKMSTTRLRPEVQVKAIAAGIKNKATMAIARAAKAAMGLAMPIGGINQRGTQQWVLRLYADGKPEIFVARKNLSPSDVVQTAHGQLGSDKIMAASSSGIFSPPKPPFDLSVSLEFWFCETEDLFFFRFTMRNPNDNFVCLSKTTSEGPTCALCKESLISPTSLCRPTNSFAGIRHFGSKTPLSKFVDTHRPGQGELIHPNYATVCRHMPGNKPGSKLVEFGLGIKRGR